MRPRPEVLAVCFRIIAEKVSNWPDDDWFTVTEEWDLNLYREDYRDKCVATLYRVKNGHTQTGLWFNIAKFTAPKEVKHE